jgi:hypothetical protein
VTVNVAVTDAGAYLTASVGIKVTDSVWAGPALSTAPAALRPGLDAVSEATLAYGVAN